MHTEDSQTNRTWWRYRSFETSKSLLKSSEGFSLVELLVAFAVIAVVLVIAVSVAGQFRVSSDRVTCINQLRQIGIIAHQYTNDHNGSYPHTLDLMLGKHVSGRGLLDLLDPYVRGDYRFFYCTNAGTASTADDPSTSFTYDYQHSLSGSLYHYAIGYFWLPSTSNQWPAAPQKVIGSTRRILAMCPNLTGANVHQRRINALFTDGHVEVRMADVHGRLIDDVDWMTLELRPSAENR